MEGDIYKRQIGKRAVLKLSKNNTASLFKNDFSVKWPRYSISNLICILRIYDI